MHIYIFTNVLLFGTINIVSNFLFPNPTSTFPSFSRKCFQDLLNLAVSNSFFSVKWSIFQTGGEFRYGPTFISILWQIFSCHSMSKYGWPIALLILPPYFTDVMLTIPLLFSNRNLTPICSFIILMHNIKIFYLLLSTNKIIKIPF